MPNPSNQLDLVNLFQTVATTLAQNQQSLNQADTFNHNHGDNMVQMFEMISNAMREKKNSDPASQLAHAGQVLSQWKSGSAQVYARGLTQAAQEFKGQNQINPEDVLKLIATLMGGGQASTGRTSPGIADVLSPLLSGSGAQPQQDSGPIGVNDLLNAGMAFLNAKQQGSSNLDALVKAIVADSPMSESEHRSESGALVANTLLRAITALASKK